jgi:hypothetical protein
MKNDKCYKCGGTGNQKDAPGIKCRCCGGSGKATYTPIKKEGVGAVYTKDIKKDPKHTTNPVTKKVNRWTVKFNEVATREGKTSPNSDDIVKLINSLKKNTAIMFYGLTLQQRIYVRRTSEGHLEVIDNRDNEQLIRMPEETDKIRMVADQLAAMWRKFNLYKIVSVIPSRIPQPPTEGITGATISKNELREVITELVKEMWTGWEEGQGYNRWLDNHDGNKCPKCKKFHHARGTSLTVLNPNNPIIYQCKNCGHKWNPDNEKSTITKVDDKSWLTKEGYPGDTWNPKTFIRTPKEISTLIFGLDEGGGITFMSDKQGRSTDWIAIEKTIEGDEYVYKYFTYQDRGNKHHLGLDEDVMDLAAKIAQNPKLTLYEFYEVTHSDGGSYRKQPRELYEAKGMNEKEKLRNIIRESIKEIHDETDLSNPEEAKEIQIGKEILKLTQWAGSEKNQEAWDRVEELAKELIQMHGQVKEVVPPGWEKTVKGMKKHPGIDNPWALAHWMKNKGMKSHK